MVIPEFLLATLVSFVGISRLVLFIYLFIYLFFGVLSISIHFMMREMKERQHMTDQSKFNI